MPEPNPPKLVPLYAARVEDLRPGTWVKVICEACGHSAEVASETIQARLPGHEPIRWLDRKLKCERCGALGDTIIDCRAALGYR